MKVNMLDYIGTINDKKRVAEELSKKIKCLKGLTVKQVAGKLNEEHHKKFRYYDKDYNQLEEDCENAKFLWVDTGFKDYIHEKVFIQFIKEKNKWVCNHVGNEPSILEFQTNWDRIKYNDKNIDYVIKPLKLENKISKKSAEQNKSVEKAGEETEGSLNKSSANLEDDETKNKCFSGSEDTLDSLIKKSIIKQSWQNDVERVKGYLTSILFRINHLISKGEDVSGYILFNENKTKCIFNTGLLDMYSNDIKVIIDVVDGKLRCNNIEILSSKKNALALGFSMEDLKKDIQRVIFYNSDISELVCNANEEDIDYFNEERLHHCIEERRERLPDNYKSLPTEMIFNDIMSTIKRAIKFNKLNGRYIKPIYYRREDRIDFIVPYNAGISLSEEPNMGIIVSVLDGIWDIMTIIEYSEVIKSGDVFNIYN